MHYICRHSTRFSYLENPALLLQPNPLSSRTFMSISPTDAQRSASTSSAALSQNPNPKHGFLRSPQFVVGDPEPFDRDCQALGSIHICASEGVFSGSSSKGTATKAAEDSCLSSKKITGLQTPNEKGLDGQDHGTSSQSVVADRGVSSQFQSAHLNGKLSGTVSLSHIDQPPTGSSSVHGGSTHSMPRKNQNANHLLNFHYDPISRPQPRMPTPRRPQKIKRYNKDLFIQANFKFVVLDSGNYSTESSDPDNMLQWEDVVCVKYSAPLPVQCPICLESPLCSQITSCGHIFCFPCILRYLLMGDENHKGDCWKKCPLCFMMISSKDLYTVHIDRVKQYNVGDHVDFALLTRPKDSLVPSQKCPGIGSKPYNTDSLCGSFCKFALTTDVDLAVREPMMELNDWLAKAESGLVEDLEQLPYVCAAIEHLEQRKKSWSEHQAFSSSLPSRSHTVGSDSKICKYVPNKTEPYVPPIASDASDSGVCRTATGMKSSNCKNESNWSSNLSSERLVREDSVLPADIVESFGVTQKVLLLDDNNKCMQKHLNGPKDVKEKDSYCFYQATDGQHLILHPLNMKCLLHHYGSYDLLPSRIGGEILQLETVTQSEAMRRRYRFLSHFSLTTTFQLCEIDLSNLLPLDALSPFIDEIRKRKVQRKRLAKKEKEERVRAEAATIHGIPTPSDCKHYYNEASFSIDDFETLGSPLSSTSPPVIGERKLFSQVTRLGFAAAHDSPSLKAETAVASSSTEAPGEATNLAGQRSASTSSFASVLSTVKPGSDAEGVKVNGLGKKGKKSSRVLLSTTGGRRY